MSNVEHDRLTSAVALSEDKALDRAIRPKTLADYHVCNNDASLQAKLVQSYTSGGQVGSCDGQDPICHSPLWFYSPTP